MPRAKGVEMMTFVRYVSGMFCSQFQVLGAVLLLIFSVGCGKNAEQETRERLSSFEPYAATEFMQQIYDLNAEQAASLIEQNPSILILDIRGTEAFNRSRLPKALSYDRTFEGFRDEVGVFERDDLVLIYGSNTPEGGQQVAIAVGDLKELGFATIHFINTAIGIEGWVEAGNQVDRGL